MSYNPAGTVHLPPCSNIIDEIAYLERHGAYVHLTPRPTAPPLRPFHPHNSVNRTLQLPNYPRSAHPPPQYPPPGVHPYFGAAPQNQGVIDGSTFYAGDAPPHGGTLYPPALSTPPWDGILRRPGDAPLHTGDERVQELAACMRRAREEEWRMAVPMLPSLGTGDTRVLELARGMQRAREEQWVQTQTQTQCGRGGRNMEALVEAAKYARREMEMEMGDRGQSTEGTGGGVSTRPERAV